MKYVTTQESDAYFEYSIHYDDWDALTADEKERALVTATRKIDAQRLIGEKYDPNQDLEFPRRYSKGYDEEVPQAVKDACCEEALALTKETSLAASGVTSVKAGDASESYSAEVLTNAQKFGLYPHARKLLQRWIKKSLDIR